MKDRKRGFRACLSAMGFRYLLALLLAGALYLQALAQDQQQIVTTEIAPSLYLLHGYTPNVIASVGPDGILLCDASYEELGEKISSALGRPGKEKIRYIINTHWHFDHAGGNKVFGRNAIIIAHETVRPYLMTDQLLLAQVQKAYPERAVPNLTLAGPTTVYFNDEVIKLLPLPGGHTDGDMIVYFEKANVLHVGDIVFTDMLPFIDLERGGNVLRLIENLRTIIATMPPNVRIIPGHVRECNIGDLRDYQKMLEATVNVVRAEMERGKSLAEIKAAGVLKDWEKWATGPARCDDWIEAIYRSLLVDRPAPAAGGVARSSDVESIDAVVKALYESISFPDGKGPDWDRFRNLFSSAAGPCIRMASDGVLPMDRESFIAFFDGRIKKGTLKSFAEREIGRTAEIYGGLAQVFSIYEKRLNLADPEKPIRGINGLQLILKDGRWWIASLAWQEESAGLPIPPTYID